MVIPSTESATNPQTADDEAAVARIVQRVQQIFRDGGHDRACVLADETIESGVRHPWLYYLRALGKGRRKEYQKALADFESARALAPDDPALHEATGHCLTMLARFREAIESFDAALDLKPDFARAHYRKGVALGMLNETDEMRAAHARVVEIEPQNADALASLAFIAARKGDVGEAKTYGELAIRIRPGHSLARVALAIADIEEDQYASANETLARILNSPAGNEDGRLNMALGFAADALDRRGRYKDAFHLCSEVNARRRRIHAPRFTNRRAIDDVNKLIGLIEHCEFSPPDKPIVETSAGAAGHVFLLGFVRSGTTLLETILASHPSVMASDERDFLAVAANELLHGDDGLQRLAALDADGIARLRSDYWRAVSGVGLSVAGKIFVDKVPMNSLRLPLIARIFPDAKILLAIRDPRDVVLSAFRRRFNMYPASFEFLQLDDCARFYAAVMRLVGAMRVKAPFLKVCEIRYEDIISEFDRAISAACDFIGIQCAESMRHFQNASGVIDRRSQSAAQVRHGLYNGATEHWRRYVAQIAPVVPILAPWIQRFGYPEAVAER